MHLKAYEFQRQSTRIRAGIPLRVITLDPRAEFSERTKTLVISVEGCQITLSRPLERSTIVKLDELPCGRSATARVVNCTPVGRRADRWLLSIAFHEPGNVWGIESPPADWEGGKGSRAS